MEPKQLNIITKNGVLHFDSQYWHILTLKWLKNAVKWLLLSSYSYYKPRDLLLNGHQQCRFDSPLNGFSVFFAGCITMVQIAWYTLGYKAYKAMVSQHLSPKIFTPKILTPLFYEAAMNINPIQEHAKKPHRFPRWIRSDQQLWITPSFSLDFSHHSNDHLPYPGPIFWCPFPSIG